MEFFKKIQIYRTNLIGIDFDSIGKICFKITVITFKGLKFKFDDIEGKL
jgi:hypothetical protein